jgi:hypothetical protein
MSNGSRTREEARRLFRQRVRAAAKRADEAFKGKYKAEIAELLGLSAADIAAVTPGVAGLQEYAALIEVVKEASRTNLAQADLKTRITNLGQTAVDIAKKVAGLAGILV